MKRLIPILLILVFSFCAIARAEENQPLSPEIIALDKLAAEIEQALRDRPQEVVKASNLHLQALARIKAAREFLLKKPKDERAGNMVAACKLLTELAVLEINTRRNEYEIAQIEMGRDARLKEVYSLFDKINQTHVRISDIEMEHIAKFKADLAKEKRRYEDVREQAKVQFSRLENELIQVRNEAHRTIISMSDILFKTDQATLTDKLRINLAKIAGILTVFRETNVTVEGHTDNVGTEAYNQKLSQDRANNVMDFLIAQGIDEGRLKAVGYNFSRPVASNDTEEGRKKNRRVDLVIVGQEMDETSGSANK